MVLKFILSQVGSPISYFSAKILAHIVLVKPKNNRAGIAKASFLVIMYVLAPIAAVVAYMFELLCSIRPLDLKLGRPQTTSRANPPNVAVTVPATTARPVL